MLDVDRLQQVGGIAGSLRREKSPRRPYGGGGLASPDLRPRSDVVDDLLLLSNGARRGGDLQTKKHPSFLKVETDHKIKIPTKNIMESSSKNAGGASVKIIMEKEMQKHVESRQQSPSVIAKLMGLDSLPAQKPQNRQKDSILFFHREKSEGLLEKQMPCEGRNQEFKDIFEVLEPRKSEKHNWHGPKGSLSSRRRDKEMPMVQSKPKYMIKKHLQAGNKFQNTDVFDKSPEASNSIKDYGAKSFEGSTSLFERYLRDLHSFPATPEGSQITILKSSSVAKCEKNEAFRVSEKGAEKKTRTRESNQQNCESEFFVPIIRKQMNIHSTKSSRSKLGGNMEKSSLPTRIVVLKPCLEKSQMHARLQDTSEILQLGNMDYKKHMDFRESGSLGPLSDLRERRELFDDEDTIKKINGSREVAKEITKHMRQSVIEDFGTYDAGNDIFFGQGSLYRKASDSARTESEAVRKTCHFNGWSKDYSSHNLPESRANREGKKHLSERWMTTHKFKDTGLPGDSLSTLGEMLALSGRETSGMRPNSVSCHESSHAIFHQKHVPGRCFSPSGISSRDGWKNGCSSMLSKSRSLPATSSLYRSPNSSNKRNTRHAENQLMLKDAMNPGSIKFSTEKSFGQKFVFPYGGEQVRWSASQSSCHEGDNKLSVKEIHVDEKKSSAYEKSICSKTPCSIFDATNVTDCRSAVCGSEDLTLSTSKQELVQSFGNAPAANESFPVDNKGSIIGKERLDNQSDDSSLSCTHVNEQACSPVAEEVEQPIPFSVLEPPDENECSPASFGRVSAELQGLRMQLELLRLESRETHADRSIVSNEDAGDERIDGLIAEIQPTSGDKGERDSFYLLDILKNSGFDNADQDALFSTFHSPESPVCPDVFEKLEKIYAGATWARSERKLLFDFVNLVLANYLALRMDRQSWARPRRIELIGCRKNLKEEVCQQVLKQRKVVDNGASGMFMDNVKWLDMTDDVDSIGREVEKMLKDDLIEDLISEIIAA